MVKVHYFFDPLCGWCYGATPLIQVLAQSSQVELVYHPGGMIPRRPIELAFRQHILKADEEITKQTKMEFGDAYKARLVSDEEMILDSYLTAQAFLAGQAMGVEPYHMLSSIQRGHYQMGLQLENIKVLKQLAMSMGLEGEAWDVNLANAKNAVLAEIENSHGLMQRWNVSGYPTLILETEKENKRLSISSYYGDAPKWQRYIDSL